MSKWELRQGYGLGMTICFLSGLRDTGHDIFEADLQRKAVFAGEREAVHLGDDAFDIVQHCIRHHVSGYYTGLRWGLFTITAAEWRVIAPEMRRLSRQLRLRSLRQINLPAYHSDRLSNLRQKRAYLASRTEIAAMLDELSLVISRWTDVWPVVHVHGY